MKKETIIDALLDLIIKCLMALVIGYCLKDVWNQSLVTMFHVNEMSFSAGTGIVAILWLLTRVVVDAFLSAIKFSPMPPPTEPSKNNDDDDEEDKNTYA